MADTLEIKLDEKGLEAALKSSAALKATGDAASRIASAATASGAGFRTVEWDKPGKGHVGGTAPHFVSDVIVGKRSAVGLVWTGNYSAAKFNAATNALLKSLRG